MSEKSKSFKNLFLIFLGFIKSIFKFLFQNKLGRLLLTIILLVISGYLLYSSGEKAGAKKQLVIDQKKMVSINKSPLPFGINNNINLKRKSIVGNVVSISDKQIEVKPKAGNNVKVKINKETVIYGLDRKKTDYKAIKKDQLVYVTASTGDDNLNSAIRIRVQK